MAHNYFHFEEGDDEDLMRLYNPSEYYRLNPYIPSLSTPVVNIPEPVIPSGGNNPNSPNADPFGIMAGTYEANPNLLGQYVGYFDPAYDPAPGGTGSTFSNPDGTLGSLAPGDLQGYSGPMTPLGMSFEDATNAFNDDNDASGLFGNTSFGDIFGFTQNFSPTVLGMKTIGFMRDLVNNALGYNTPDGTDTTGGDGTNTGIGGFTEADVNRESFRGNPTGSTGGNTSGGGATTGNEGSGSGAVGSTGPTGRSRGGW
jgi:hypothetical protein